MARFILRYRGKGSAPAEDVERVRNTRAVLVDDQTSRMLLVSGPQSTVARLVASMPGWSMTPERSVSLPDPGRKKPMKK